MLETFLATINPMLTLFLCMVVGFIARKTKILPDNAGKTMAKLETWIFLPALSFSTMAAFCTVETIKDHIVNVLLGTVAVLFSMSIATLLSRLFVKKDMHERGIYTYALGFANGGYLGDPVVQSLFGNGMLSYYKLFYLPVSISIYTWGIGKMVPDGEHKKGFLRKLINAPTVALLAGVAVGLSGLGAHIPAFVDSALDSLKACMGPVAMLLAGFTVAGYDVSKVLKNKKIYVVAVLRLIVLPIAVVLVVFCAKELANLAFDMSIDNNVLFLAFFSTASAIGMNTIVFPEAYGGDSSIGVGMTLISHTAAVITIPIMYVLMVALFGSVAIL